MAIGMLMGQSTTMATIFRMCHLGPMAETKVAILMEIGMVHTEIRDIVGPNVKFVIGSITQLRIVINVTIILIHRVPMLLHFIDPPSPYMNAYLNWFPDTGATHHATPDLTALSRAHTYTGTVTLQVGNGNGLGIAHIGSSSLNIPNSTFQLNNILHVPSLTKLLLSVNKFTTDNNVYFEFHPNVFRVTDHESGKILLSGPSDHGLYTLSGSSFPASKNLSAFLSAKASSDCWHSHLGHPHSRIFEQTVSQNNC